MFTAQCNFYSYKILECQNRSKALWKVINDITQRKKKTNGILQKLKLENGRFIENPLDIAKTLNEYFVNVGPNLAGKLTPSNISFENYLNKNNSPNNSFYLAPTTPKEISDTGDSFSSSMCEAPDLISPKFYKVCAAPLSEILAKLINQCFTNGYFPKCLKLAKVIPIFKGGNTQDLGNWRPISITPCIAKLIEKTCEKAFNILFGQTQHII